MNYHKLVMTYVLNIPRISGCRLQTRNTISRFATVLRDPNFEYTVTRPVN